MLNLYEQLQKQVRKNPNDAAICFLPDPVQAQQIQIRMNYGQLFSMINQAGHWINSLAMKRNPVVSSVLPNIPQSYALHWAASTVGINHPVSPGLPVDDIVNLIIEANSDLVVLPPADLYPPAAAIAEQLKLKKFSGKVEMPPRDFNDFSIENLQCNKKPDDICSIYHTSATTNRPKQMQFSLANQTAMLDMLQKQFQFSQGDKILIGFPLFHISAVVYNLLPLLKGSELIVLGPMGWLTPNVDQQIWTLVEKFSATHFAVLPFSGKALLTTKPGNIQSLRSVLFGMPLEREQFEKIKSILNQVDIFHIYGATESGGLMSTQTNTCTRWIGAPLTGQEVKLFRFDSDGNCLGESNKPGEIGEICIKGANVGTYLTASDQRNSNWNGYIRLQDIGRINNQGQIEYFCRKQDLCFKDGKPQSCFDLDLILATHPAVANVGVIPSEDAKHTIAFIQLKSTAQHPFTLANLKNWYEQENISLDLLPNEMQIVDHIEVNGMGKVIKPRLHALRKQENRETQVA